jgi:hypothetical protein
VFIVVSFAVAGDSGDKNMTTISPEKARANIIAAYTKQHEEAVSALSSAMERMKGTKTEDKTETVSDLKPSLAELLLAGGAK